MKLTKSKDEHRADSVTCLSASFMGFQTQFLPHRIQVYFDLTLMHKLSNF